MSANGCTRTVRLQYLLQLLHSIWFTKRGYYIPNISSFRIECEEAQEDENEDPNDLPVQGPLPQEPEDAPWKRNESGVRRL